MQETAGNLRKTLGEVLPLLQNIGDEGASIKPFPHKWPHKEILGHLIDSACSNQQKFVRTMVSSQIDFVGYQQDHWVDSQKYNAASRHDSINLWRAYDLHLAYIIKNVGGRLLVNEIVIQNARTFTLEFIIKDYVGHLKRHLNQILPKANLQNNFQNIYNT